MLPHVQVLDAGEVDSLEEVADYYREIYGILSLQAMHQVKHTKLHLQPLAHDILGDQNLVRYLFEILKKQSGQKRLDIAYSQKADRYMTLTIPMPQLKLSEEEFKEIAAKIYAEFKKQ